MKCFPDRCKVKDTDNLKGGVYIVNGRNGIW